MLLASLLDSGASGNPDDVAPVAKLFVCEDIG